MAPERGTDEVETMTEHKVGTCEEWLRAREKDYPAGCTVCSSDDEH
jgi:hypothetical protein